MCLSVTDGGALSAAAIRGLLWACDCGLLTDPSVHNVPATRGIPLRMRELFERAAAGDSSAQEELAGEIRRIARAVCRGKGPGGADVDWEDVAQEASSHFFAVAIHQFRKRGAETSYLYAIVRTTFLQILRSSSRRRDRENQAPPPETPRHNPDTGIDVRRLLSRISSECADLLERVFLHGEAYSALAAELDMLESSVRTKVSRCLRRARMAATEGEAT